ncbi:thioredoxin family protein [Sabulilitoribacter multivorans]|uniref:Thioredoxin family protein n=1 Tax=Flaviramulus multivorans TaxID=1304750 RepID=A0ABS9IKA0_9FLAO|nr:thioredoxin family protein [Flaviramulus multivorans]MCF7561029.1 thioredoxin family protein [Flaviramulus multivorans]
MKKIFFTLFLAVFISANGTAQEKLTWHTDMNKAFDIATKENKTLLLFFTGSDWCGWCIRLQKEVLKTPDFEKWAKDKVVLVELDFPRRTPQDNNLKIQNYQMQKMFNVNGYPTVFFAKPEKTAEGKKNLNTLGRTGYVRGGPEKWLEVANNIVANN